ncbi:MAG: hypothetical protein QXG65_04425, partial [Thermoplasmata archaeon]
RKLAGVLIDEVATPSHGLREVVGVGVNVAPLDPAAIPADLRERVTSLGDLGARGLSLETVEARVAEAIRRAGAALSTRAEAEALWARLGRRLYGVGRPVRIDGAPVGRIEGVGPEGELWVRSGTDRLAIRAGDVEVAQDP